MFGLRTFNVTIALAVGLIIILGAPSSVVAYDVERIYKRSDKYRDIYKGYTFPPPKEFLSKADFDRFIERKAVGHCWSAVMVLAQAFAKKHPKALHPVNDPLGRAAWNIVVVPRHYPGLMLCHELPILKANQQKVQSANLFAPRYPQKRTWWGPEFDRLPRLVKRRDGSVLSLIKLAIADHAPAQLALAKLSDEGKVLRLTPSYMYYVLARAKRSGLKDESLERLHKNARAALSDAERNDLSSRIESGIWPRSEPLVVD